MKVQIHLEFTNNVYYAVIRVRMQNIESFGYTEKECIRSLLMNFYKYLSDCCGLGFNIKTYNDDFSRIQLQDSIIEKWKKTDQSKQQTLNLHLNLLISDAKI